MSGITKIHGLKECGLTRGKGRYLIKTLDVNNYSFIVEMEDLTLYKFHCKLCKGIAR
jgi:hypothetical protein